MPLTKNFKLFNRRTQLPINMSKHFAIDLLGGHLNLLHASMNIMSNKIFTMFAEKVRSSGLNNFLSLRRELYNIQGNLQSLSLIWIIMVYK